MKEAQFLRGVAIVKINSEEARVRMLLLDCTDTKVIGISEYKKLLNKEISKVKLLTSNKSKWLVAYRRENYIYMSNPISMLSSIKLTTSNCLSEAKIETIRDILTTTTKPCYVS